MFIFFIYYTWVFYFLIFRWIFIIWNWIYFINTKITIIIIIIIISCWIKRSTKYKFYPLKAELSENLKKDLNEDLLKRKISDIFENTEINKKNIKFENPNKKLIRKILKEEIEPQTIFILNLSFNDILDFIRENDSENFLEKIREKELKNEGDEEYVEEYMKEVSRLLNGYEKWFEKKLSRNSKKRINKKKQKYMF